VTEDGTSKAKMGPRLMDDSLPELTSKQCRFVIEYLKDLNATQAANRAGYSEKTAAEQGCRLLRNVKVRAAIEAAQAEMAKKLEVTRERVLKEAARLAFSDHRKMFDDAGRLKPIHDLDDDTAAAIAGIEVVERAVPGGEGRTEFVHKIKFWDKNSALDKLCRHLGLATEKHEHKVLDENDKPISTLEVARQILFSLRLAAERVERDPLKTANSEANAQGDA
jgi:phage terminase small subunit